MAEEKSTREKVREIVALLPKENCGKCGFENCGTMALAVAEGEASAFGCRKDHSAGYAISKVLGIEATEGLRVPAVRSGYSHGSRRHGGDHRGGHHGHGHGRDKGAKERRHSGRHHPKLPGHRILKMLGRLV